MRLFSGVAKMPMIVLSKSCGSPGGNIDMPVGYGVKAAGVESDNQELGLLLKY